MIRSLYRTPDGQCHANLDPDGYRAALEDPAGLLWVDFEGEPDNVCEPILRDIFKFHPLSVDDALAEAHVPKVDDWGGYIYIVLHSIAFDADKATGYMDTMEVDIFLGKNYVVTYHDYSIAALGRLWGACHRDERHLQKGADYLAYRLADELVTDYMPAVEQMEEAIDQIEDEIFDRPAPDTLERIFNLKRALLRLRRIMMPQREVLNKLARGDFPQIDDESRAFFRDIYDHLVRMNDIIESVRDLVSGAMDTYLSVINNRMSEVMKTLTLITTFFMPLSFIAAFFGMNFFLPRPEDTAWINFLVLVVTLGIMLLSPVGMYLWIRRRGWL